MEGTRNRLTIAICAALTAGALASAGAIAHDVDKAQASATTTPVTGTTSATSSTATMDRERTTDADQAKSKMSSSASQPSTAGYGAATNASASTDDTTQSSQASGTTGATSGDYDQSRTGSTRSGSSAQAKGAGDVVWFVIPVALENQGDQMSNGCWVRLYSGDNFEGRYVSIVGPTGIREMRSPYGTGMNNWESAVVGPNATVTTYDGEDFRDRNATLRAAQRYPDLDDSKLGLFDDIESIKVECSDASRSGSSGS